ncbi:MAG: hypothetical protein SCK70_14600 [bacterium]|nr:hypothetical protein [bacterium]
MSDIATEPTLFDMALYIAQKCQQLYQAMEQHTQHDELKKNYRLLSAESADQIKLFQDLSLNFNDIIIDDQTALDNPRFYFNSILQAQSLFDCLIKNGTHSILFDDISVLQLAISFEKDTILFGDEIIGLSGGKLAQSIADYLERKKIRVSKLLEMKRKLLENYPIHNIRKNDLILPNGDTNHIKNV